MQLKDHYKVLGVARDADVQDVKKAYRRLAMQHHPDTGDGSALSDSTFLEIKEAYEILSDPNTRQRYDEACWLSGMFHRMEEQPEVTPMWILEEAIRLHNHMSTVDVYRMNHRALYDYVCCLLGDEQVKMLQNSEEPSVNEGIINMLLPATRGLKYRLMLPLSEKLLQIGGEESRRAIEEALSARRRQARWDQRMPYVIAAVTFVIVVCMYFWAIK